MEATLEQAHEIINSHDENENARVASFSEIESTNYSYTASCRSYHITALSSESDEAKSYLLLTSPLASGHPQPPPQPIALPALSALLSTILDDTAVPVPRPIAHDVSGGGGRWHFGWLLLRVPGSSPIEMGPPTSLASVRHQLSPVQLARIELRLGTYLRALHGITHDWFGAPTNEPTPTSVPLSVPSLTALFGANQGQTGEDGEEEGEDMTPYSWQDTFVLRLEELLERVCGDAEARKTAPSGYMVDLNVDALRLALSRAIGSFLFDDVEMPRLVWVTGNDEDVIVTLTSGRRGSDDDSTASGQDTEVDIAYLLPTFGHALWGDPLMEAWFLPPGPSTAIKEGYFGDGEDAALIVLPRHKTKRMWYTVYLALMVLAEEMLQEEEGKTTRVSGRESVRWAKSILPECGEMLKNAPCY